MAGNERNGESLQMRTVQRIGIWVSAFICRHRGIGGVSTLLGQCEHEGDGTMQYLAEDLRAAHDLGFVAVEHLADLRSV